MAEFLVVTLPPEPDTHCSWIVVNDEGTRLSGVTTGELTQAVPTANERKVIALVPGTEVLLTHVDLPVKSQAKLRQAVPFALEDQLADDVDTMHFAVGKRGDDSTTPVAAVNRDRLEQWINLLDEAGVGAHFIVAETEGVPQLPGAFTLLLNEDCTYVTDPAGDRFVVQTDDLEEVIDCIGILDQLDEDEEDETGSEPAGRHLTVFLSETDHDRLKGYLDGLRERVDSLEVKLLSEGPLPHLSVNVAAGPGINLLQGKYAPSTDVSLLWRPWRMAASLLLGLFVVILGVKAAELQRLNAKEEQLDASMRTLYEEVFPGAPPTSNPAREMMRLAAGQAGAEPSDQEFMRTLSALGAAMAETSGARIEDLSFRGGVMELRLNVSSTETLETIKTEVGKSESLTAQIESVNRRGDAWQGRIKITGLEE